MYLAGAASAGGADDRAVDAPSIVELKKETKSQLEFAGQRATPAQQQMHRAKGTPFRNPNPTEACGGKREQKAANGQMRPRGGHS